MKTTILKKEEYIELDYFELDALVKQHYPKSDYDFVSDHEANNDNVYRFNEVDGILNKLEVDDMKKFEKGKIVSFITSILLNALCNKGVIEPGNYLIKVCW